eukprot:6692832-Pyramimonas_sp.AAC.1
MFRHAFVLADADADAMRGAVMALLEDPQLEVRWKRPAAFGHFRSFLVIFFVGRHVGQTGSTRVERRVERRTVRRVERRTERGVVQLYNVLYDAYYKRIFTIVQRNIHVERRIIRLYYVLYEGIIQRIRIGQPCFFYLPSSFLRADSPAGVSDRSKKERALY